MSTDHACWVAFRSLSMKGNTLGCCYQDCAGYLTMFPVLTPDALYSSSLACTTT